MHLTHYASNIIRDTRHTTHPVELVKSGYQTTSQTRISQSDRSKPANQSNRQIIKLPAQNQFKKPKKFEKFKETAKRGIDRYQRLSFCLSVSGSGFWIRVHIHVHVRLRVHIQGSCSCLAYGFEFMSVFMFRVQLRESVDYIVLPSVLMFILIKVLVLVLTGLVLTVLVLMG